ncbi:hypothetical protein TNCV_2359291 [Trichonephila clavipes]|nr:hypothetical protein TNCV_2359291 [Trichonephila clavipes]
MGCNCLQYTVTPSFDLCDTMSARRYDHWAPATAWVATHGTAPSSHFSTSNAWLHAARVSQDCLRTVTTLSLPV